MRSLQGTYSWAKHRNPPQPLSTGLDVIAIKRLKKMIQDQKLPGDNMVYDPNDTQNQTSLPLAHYLEDYQVEERNQRTTHPKTNLNHGRRL